jgi:hypothetical protein
MGAWSKTKLGMQTRLALALVVALSALSVVLATRIPFGAADSGGQGYWLVGADGGAFSFGNAPFYGSAATLPLTKPIVGMAAAPDGRGYWMVAADGGVFTYGDAGFHGSAAGVAINRPVVGMAADPGGQGYWLVGADGGIYSGDAGFYGSTGALPLRKPIVGMAATPDGRGYWLVAADGGVFSFGDAAFHGSAAGIALNRPVVGMAATPDGQGYWLAAADGGVFAFGDAPFFGSTQGIALNRPIVGMAPTRDGQGYWLAGADGGVFSFGDAPFGGSARPIGLRRAIVGIAPAAPSGFPTGGNTYCGSRSGPPTTTKLLVIWEENASAPSVYGNAAAPNMNTYAQDCGHATNYTSLGHPSLPNYLEATSGLPYDTNPWTSDCEASSSGCRTPAENIFDQVGPNGWKGYVQSMPAACDPSNSGPYLSRHNPAVYYTDLGLACFGNDVDVGTPAGGALQADIVNGTLPTFATLTPDVNNDQHNGTLQQADSYLGSWINEIVAGPDYQSGRLAIAIVYDEGAGSGTNSPSIVPAIFMSQFTPPGGTSNLGFTHYSLLAAAEDIAGVPRLGNAATAESLRAAFGF